MSPPTLDLRSCLLRCADSSVLDYHGLSSALEKWLFPADGSTRDFETLQVILSGEDAFWASDRYGEIKSETSDYERKLRRASTIDFSTSPASKKRWSSYISGVSKETERRRSSTLPSATRSPTQIIEPPAKPQPRHLRSLSTDRAQGPAFVPLLVRHRRMNWATRPRSDEELGTLKECPSPQLHGPSSVELKRDQIDRTKHCTCGCHGNITRNSLPLQRNIANAPPMKPRPGYADAGIQTDDLTAESQIETASKTAHKYEDIQNAYGRRYTAPSSFEFQPNSYNQRASFIADTDSGWYSPGEAWYVPNPVMMGRMQDYFRSTSYFLGDSLQPRGMG